MLFPKSETTGAVQTANGTSQCRAALLFDWENERYFMENGSPLECTGVEAVKEWVRQIVRTRRDRYRIYPTDFGAPMQTLVGQKRPRGFALSEFRRMLQESAKYHPYIRSIESVQVVGDEIRCTVYLENSAGESEEVLVLAT